MTMQHTLQHTHQEACSTLPQLQRTPAAAAHSLPTGEVECAARSRYGVCGTEWAALQ